MHHYAVSELSQTIVILNETINYRLVDSNC